MSEEEFRKIAKEYAEMYFTKGIDSTKIFNYVDELEKKVEQLEKENIRQKEVIENLTTMTVCGDKKQIKNTAQYKLEQLENIRKEAIEELTYMSTDAYVEDYDIREKHYNLLMNILNKGDSNEKNE